MNVEVKHVSEILYFEYRFQSWLARLSVGDIEPRLGLDIKYSELASPNDTVSE